MESIKELRKICQNPKEYHNPGAFIDQELWRSFSIYFTKLALYTPLKPDHITFIMIFWGFVVGFLFSIGTYWYVLLGAIALEFFILLDAIDGEMARYKKTSSLKGMFLDVVAHLTNTALPFMGITIGLYKFNPNLNIVLAGLSVCIFSILCFDIQTQKHHVMLKDIIKYAQKTEQIKSKKILKKVIQESIKKSFLKSMFKKVNYLYDHSYMIQIFLLAAIFNKLHWVLFFYGITFPLMWLVKLFHEYKTGYKPYEYLLEPYKE